MRSSDKRGRPKKDQRPLYVEGQLHHLMHGDHKKKKATNNLDNNQTADAIQRASNPNNTKPQKKSRCQKRGPNTPATMARQPATMAPDVHERGKLVGAVKVWLVRQLAMWKHEKGWKPVQSALSKHYNITVTTPTLKRFEEVHIEEIEAEREHYLGDFINTPLAHRKMRVLEAVGHYERLCKDIEAAETPQKRTKLYYYAIEWLKGIREEMEPIEPSLGRGSLDELEAFLAGLEAGKGQEDDEI